MTERDYVDTYEFFNQLIRTIITKQTIMKKEYIELNKEFSVGDIVMVCDTEPPEICVVDEINANEHTGQLKYYLKKTKKDGSASKIFYRYHAAFSESVLTLLSDSAAS